VLRQALAELGATTLRTGRFGQRIARPNGCEFPERAGLIYGTHIMVAVDCDQVGEVAAVRLPGKAVPWWWFSWLHTRTRRVCRPEPKW
jgi:hypothetical protein